MKMKTVGLIGLGAVGVPLAEHLYKAFGNHFYILADQKHAIPLRNNHWFINGAPFAPHIVSDRSELQEELDVVFVCVKNYSIASVATYLKQIISAHTVILPLQNGVYSHEYFAGEFPEHVILEGFAQGPNTKVIDTDFVYQNPGVYHMGSSNPAYAEYAEAVHHILQNSGIHCYYDQDIQKQIWKKLMLNVAGNALTAITGMNYSMFRHVPEAQTLCLAVMHEFVHVAEKKGISIREDDMQSVMQYFTTYEEPKRTSMLEDVLAKRKTENEYIAGYIYHLACDYQMEVPNIQMLYFLMKIKEKVYLKSFM